MLQYRYLRTGYFLSFSDSTNTGTGLHLVSLRVSYDSTARVDTASAPRYRVSCTCYYDIPQPLGPAWTVAARAIVASCNYLARALQGHASCSHLDDDCGSLEGAADNARHIFSWQQL